MKHTFSYNQNRFIFFFVVMFVRGKKTYTHKKSMIDSNFTVRLFFFKNGISNKTVVVASAFLHRAIHNSCSMGKTYGIQCLSFV